MALKPAWLCKDNIERRANLSREEFFRVYEQGNKPVVVTDVVPQWPAYQKWSDEYLLAAFGQQRLEAGAASLSFPHYLNYCRHTRDDAPLYIFDPRFAEKSPMLAADYHVPEYFSEDLFSVMGARRPHHRWLIIGPARSGSVWHVDPNATSAWNAVLRGCKKWILFPPGCPPPGVHPSRQGDEVTQPVSLSEWYFNYYEQLRDCDVKPIECLLRAGEIMYVPHGWWHCVINTEYTVALTQNYVGAHNLVPVAEFLLRRRGDVSGYGCGDCEEEKEPEQEGGRHTGEQKRAGRDLEGQPGEKVATRTGADAPSDTPAACSGGMMAGGAGGARLYEDFTACLEKTHPGMLAAAYKEHEQRTRAKQQCSTGLWGRARQDSGVVVPFSFDF